MENQGELTQTVTPPTPAPEVRRDWRLLMIAGIVTVIGVASLAIMRMILTKPAPPIVIVTPTPTLTPTPQPSLSTVATTSAYTALVQAHASFTTALSAANLDDASLTPPIIVLPLGFRQ